MELFKLFGTIAVDNSGANSAIEDTTEIAEQSEGKLSKFFSGVGSAAIAAGQVVATGLAVASTAIVGIAKSALEGYADYEQLVGGVETLFGTGGKSLQEYADSVGKTTDEVKDEYVSMLNAQKAVMKNADKAYKTAGMSANEYMETVTGFSAALIQSVGGDTEVAAEKANQAIIDMSDNANKMGSDITSIQNAYSGFAKQNYTMLDNLKLGYGGTQEEMKRLLADAQAISGIEYDISSYADVVDAIHVIQTEMGITGTTAKEASSTISGSIASMKSSWQNLLAGLGSGNSYDLSMLIDNFVNSFMTAANNIIPRLEIILGGIAEMIAKLMPVLADKIPALIETLLPALITGAVALFNGLVTALPTILAILIEQIPFIVTQIGQALIVAFPVLLQTVQDLFSQIWNYIAVSLLGTSADFDSTLSNMTVLFQNAWGILQTIWTTVGQPIFNMIQNLLGITRDAFASRMPEIQAFVSTCFSDIAVFWENNLKPCLEAIGDFIENVLAPVFESVFNGYIAPQIDTVFNFIKELWEGTLKPVLVGITDFLTGVFTGNWEQAWQGIQGILKGILNGIISGIEGMINGAINSINALISGINSLISKAGDLVGLDIAIPTIPTVSLPRLAKGGVLEQGQVGLLEGSGAEAVVPLENNSKWISAVANDMQTQGIGGSAESLAVLKEILAMLKELKDEGAEMLLDAIAGGLKLDINSREFARMVKVVN